MRGPPLFIPLKTQYFEAFKNGTKDTEFRVYGPRWNEDTCFVGRRVTLSKGYGKHERMSGQVTAFKFSSEPTRTASWRDCYGDSKKLAACITIRLDTVHG